MQELWQLYDEQGRPIAGKGATKSSVRKGLLHAASHVWIWRNTADGPEVLVQKRAAHKATWPNRYDVSAAGHIDLGEDPLTAAIRETKEEIGIDISAADLKLISVHRTRLKAGEEIIENEFQWVYVLQLKAAAEFTAQKDEVGELEWVPLETFKHDTAQKDLYVPHGVIYFETLVAGIERDITLL